MSKFHAEIVRPHLLDDPYLAPYRATIVGWTQRVTARAAELAAGAPTLAARMDAWKRYGLHRTTRGWTFRECAPHATALWLVGDFSGWQRTDRFRLTREPKTGDWVGRFPAPAIRDGQFYRLDLVWPEGEGERLPAYATYVVQDPVTNLFAARVHAPRTPYRWRHAAPARRADEPLRIYEAHVGMSGEAPAVAGWADFQRDVLPRVVRNGYNVLQLMAVAEHPYYGSFGYHVSNFYAPSSRFGTPEELKALVDAAHGAGLAVIMDLVHSHAVKNERDGLSQFDGTDHLYFHGGGRGWHSAWDSRCFDYAKDVTLRFLLSNCRYWLEEFHFDGYRFDGVTSMLYHHHGLGTAFTDYGMYFGAATDTDARTYLALANRVVHETNPKAITIAEDVSGMPGCAAPLADGGLGFDYRMAMGEPDHWFRLAEKVRDDDWSMSGLYHALTDRRAEEKVVSYVESHDQALVGGKTFLFQLADKAMYDGMGRDQHDAAVDRAVALHKMARLATAALNGGAYLNFMGNEFGHPEWIDFPRAENGWSYAHARRLWHLADDPTLKFRGLGDFDRTVMSLLAERPSAVARLVPHPMLLVADDAAKILAFLRGDCLFVFNFHPTVSQKACAVPVPPGAYRQLFDTDETRFAGFGRLARHRRYTPVLRRLGDNAVQHVILYVPARTAVVLRREKKGFTVGD